FPSRDPERMRAEIGRVFPGEESGYDRFMQQERIRFKRMYPCLQKDYSSFSAYFAPVFLKAIPRLALTKSLYQVLASYFRPEALRLSFTFQSKYLGMSPWSCPGAFAIIPYTEYGYGIYHVQGGLCRISQAMADVVREEGGEIRLGTPVNRVLVENRVARGVELEDGTRIEADDVIINADFAHAMTHIADPADVRKYSAANLSRREYSCSTFMLYLGLDTIYDVTHHTIAFARDYQKNLDEIANRKVLSEDISFYVRNSSVTDPHVAPEGHSAIYVLVPVPNNSSGIDWEREAGPFRDLVLDSMEARTSMKDIRQHIQVEQVIHPGNWESEHSVYNGATFNLAHSLGQMLYLRPRNRFEEWKHCYLVGGGTHPGSGLPTIYESGRISANLLTASYGIPYESPPPLPG
ncbi:phytoene desaturase family protein, partial [Gemmatimonadota bacterium]